MKVWIIVAVIIAVVIAAITITTLLKSRSWASVTAHVTSSTLEEIYHSPNSAITNHSDTHDYKLAVEYQYQVNGRTYTGSKLYAGLPNIFATKLEAEKVQKQFLQGVSVKAYYNPNKPSESALLLPNAKGGNPFIMILVGLVVAAFVGAAVIIAPKI